MDFTFYYFFLFLLFHLFCIDIRAVRFTKRLNHEKAIIKSWLFFLFSKSVAGSLKKNTVILQVLVKRNCFAIIKILIRLKEKCFYRNGKVMTFIKLFFFSL